MYTVNSTNGVVTHPFGEVSGTISYTPTLIDDVRMVHALIVSNDGAAAAARLGVGCFTFGDNQWDATPHPGASSSTGRGAANPIVTHYVGSGNAVEHHVIGSVNPAYVGRVLVREALLSADGEWLLLKGPLGMQPSTVGCILWRRIKPGKL